MSAGRFSFSWRFLCIISLMRLLLYFIVFFRQFPSLFCICWFVLHALGIATANRKTYKFSLNYVNLIFLKRPKFRMKNCPDTWKPISHSNHIFNRNNERPKKSLRRKFYLLTSALVNKASKFIWLIFCLVVNKWSIKVINRTHLWLWKMPMNHRHHQ